MNKRLGIATSLLVLISFSSKANIDFKLEIIPNPYQAPKGTYAKLVNVDGSNLVLYGTKKDFNNKEVPMAFHWNEQDGHTHLGLLNNRKVLRAMDISDDGNVVVGHNGGESFVWTKRDKMRVIPKLKRHYVNAAISISADGKTVVGYTGWGDDTSAYRWEIGKNVKEIGTGKDKVQWRSANFSSEDASVIVGTALGDVYVWKNDNSITPIKDPKGCSFIPEDVSHNGKIIGGRCSIDKPIVWHESTGFKALPVPAGAESTMIKAMSGDGTRFLGSAKYIVDEKYQYRPILWHQNNIYFLDDIVKELKPSQTIKTVIITNISSNGKVIAGGYKDSIDTYTPFKLMIQG